MYDVHFEKHFSIGRIFLLLISIYIPNAIICGCGGHNSCSFGTGHLKACLPEPTANSPRGSSMTAFTFGGTETSTSTSFPLHTSFHSQLIMPYGLSRLPLALVRVPPGFGLIITFFQPGSRGLNPATVLCSQSATLPRA